MQSTAIATTASAPTSKPRRRRPAQGRNSPHARVPPLYAEQLSAALRRAHDNRRSWLYGCGRPPPPASSAIPPGRLFKPFPARAARPTASGVTRPPPESADFVTA